METTSKIILNSEQLSGILEIIQGFFAMSKPFNTNYKNFVRLISSGDGLLHFVLNNFDTKIIEYLPIEEGQSIDKIYLINDFTSIISKLKSYEYFIVENDSIIFEDGKISLIPITLSDEEKNDIFGIDVTFDYTSQFVVDKPLNSEIDKIFKVLDMKNKKTRNSYFNDSGNLYFDFSDIRVRKPSFFDYINSDIFSLKLTASLFKQNEGFEVFMDKKNDKFFINSPNFYIDGHQTKIDSMDKQFMKLLFEEEKEIVLSVKSKLELYYFIDVIYNYDNKSSLYFGDGKVKANTQYQDFVGVFQLDDVQNESFLISTEVLMKVFKFILGYSSKVSFFEFDVVKNSVGKFLSFNVDGVEILCSLDGEF